MATRKMLIDSPRRFESRIDETRMSNTSKLLPPANGKSASDVTDVSATFILEQDCSTTHLTLFTEIIRSNTFRYRPVRKNDFRKTHFVSSNQSSAWVFWVILIVPLSFVRWTIDHVISCQVQKMEGIRTTKRLTRLNWVQWKDACKYPRP